MPVAIPVLAHITADNAEKYKLSIRLRPDGLSFSVYQVADKGDFLHKEVDFDRSKPYLAALKEFFFGHDFLSFPFKRVDIVVIGAQFMTVPHILFDEKRIGELMQFTFGDAPQRYLHHALADDSSVFLYGMDEEVYEFCSRSLIQPRFIHGLVPLLNRWKKQNRNQTFGQCFLLIYPDFFTLAFLREGKLVFLNAFGYQQFSDLEYLVLYAWQQTGFDQLKDQLLVRNETRHTDNFPEQLKTYIKHIHPMTLPAEAFLLGAGVAQAPMDIISLALCES